MSYLYRMNRWKSPSCNYCNDENDDAYHTFFECQRWKAHREVAEQQIGETLTVENIISNMVTTKEGWNAITVLAESVLRLKQAESNGFEERQSVDKEQ